MGDVLCQPVCAVNEKGSWMPVDTRITLHKLEVFRTVAELGSVSKAAERFFVAQPVVSAHLRSLEQKLGVKLVYREGRSLKLTPAGEATYRWTLDMLTHTHELSRHLDGLADGTSGRVVLAASMSVGSYVLPQALSEFRLQNPSIEISLNIYHSDHAIRATDSGECDFAVIFAEAPPESTMLTGERLGYEPLVLVTAPSGPPADDEIDLDQVASLSFVELPEGFLRRTLNDRHLKQAGLNRRKIAIELGHPEAIKRAVKAGLGAALLFQCSVAEELEAGTLRAIRVEGLDVAVPIHLVHRAGRQFSSAQQRVIDAIADSVAATPTALTEP